MYTERLNNLLEHDLQEILSSKLLIELLSLWSIAYNGRKPCSTCKPDHVKYYYALKQNGKQIFERMDNQLFLLKSNTCIQTIGKIYRIDNTSDDDAIVLLKRNPAYIKQFDKYPKDWQEIVNVMSEPVVKKEVVNTETTTQKAPVKRKRTTKPKV